MAEALSFEEKIQGLISYHQALELMEPNNPEHIEVANPAFFYGGGSGAVSGLTEAEKCARMSIENHARSEYTHYGGGRGFDVMDLRDDTHEQRAERADLLALMTAPLTPELRRERADHIASILAAITAGETIVIKRYDTFLREHKDPQEFTIDASRALFGVFSNGHISSRVLNVQYDTPVYWPKKEAGENAINLDIESILKGGDLVEPATVAV